MSDVDREKEADMFLSDSLGGIDRLTSTQLSRTNKITSRYLQNKPTLGSTNVFGVGVSQGHSPGPCIFVGEIFNVESTVSDRITDMEYLMTLIAREGDVMLLNGDRNCEFEKYRQNELRLGNIEIIETSKEELTSLNSTTPKPSLKRLIDYIQTTFTTETINIIPFCGSSALWSLAGYIATQTGLNVSVAAPAPKLTPLVNDRLWFRELAKSLFEPDEIPMTKPAYGPESLLHLVRAFAKNYSKVVVRISNGIDIYCNVKMNSETIMSSTDDELGTLLTVVLKDHDWNNKYPLMVEVWDTEVLSNPSVQVWVPAKGTGSPIVEGIFDRSLLNATDGLVIAKPAEIPPHLEQIVIDEAIQLAVALQQLGYFGKLDIEGIISGSNITNSQLYWTGCNGRWSGLTLPVALSNRLFDTKNITVSIAQLTFKDAANSCFSVIHAALHDLLYTRSNKEGRVLLLVPCGSSRIIKFMTVGHSSAQTEKIAKEVATRLIRLNELRLDPMLA